MYDLAHPNGNFVFFPQAFTDILSEIDCLSFARLPWSGCEHLLEIDILLLILYFI
jgi:hypothetical protein